VAGELRMMKTALGPLALLMLAACSGEVGGGPAQPQGTGAAASTGATGAGAGAGGAGPSAGGAAGTAPGAGGSTMTSGGTAGAPPTGGAGPGTGGTTQATGGTAGTGVEPLPTPCADQAAIQPGRAPLRRLTKFEYNNTVRDLLGDDTNPAFAFPSELTGNGFGNDADAQPVSSVLADQYAKVAEGVAARATGTPQKLALLNACASSVTTANQQACARTIIESFLPKAYRRPLAAGEANAHVALFDTLVAGSTFASAIAGVLEAVLQSPEFLYKVEFGTPDTANPSLKRPTGHEMATRLSYFFWGTQPDAALTAAAASGELGTAAGVLAQAQRLLADPKTRGTVRHFFDNLLPISALTDLARDTQQYPTFSSAIGALMQTETRTFLDYVIFEGPGTWPSVLTAPYTFVNQQLATYYGMTGVTGTEFRKVDLDTTKRLGLLTQGAVMTGLTPTNFTNPVQRGGFLVNHIMCRGVEVPTDPAVLELVKQPDPYSAPTGRERYTIHSQNPVCAGCHAQLDPLGFGLENYDAVGLYRATENMVTIDASGAVPDMVGGEFTNPIEMVQRLAANEEVQACFASEWLDFAYGQSLTEHRPDDVCTRESLYAEFRKSGYNVKQLLLDLTQTDGFLYLGRQDLGPEQ
jgi:hypothetical protein